MLCLKLKPVDLQHTQTDNISTQSMQIIHSETRRGSLEQKQEHYRPKTRRRTQRRTLYRAVYKRSRKIKVRRLYWGSDCSWDQEGGISNKTKEAKIGEINDKNSANCECVLGLGQGL